MSGSRSLYLVCYDISNDRMRSRIEKNLEDYGKRVQKSVFECLLSSASRKRMEERLAALFESAGINPQSDSLRIFRICESCREKSTMLGLDRTPDPYIQVI